MRCTTFAKTLQRAGAAVAAARHTARRASAAAPRRATTAAGLGQRTHCAAKRAAKQRGVVNVYAKLSRPPAQSTVKKNYSLLINTMHSIYPAGERFDDRAHVMGSRAVLTEVATWRLHLNFLLPIARSRSSQLESPVARLMCMVCCRC